MWRTCRNACRDRWLAVSFEVGGGENVSGIPSAFATRNFTHLARGPLQRLFFCITSLETLHFNLQPHFPGANQLINHGSVLFQKLRLDFNAISHIDENSFTNTTALTHLYISHNALVSLPPIQDLADTLITLEVTYNQIQMIPDLYFTSCAVLEYILLSANNLTMISNSAFSGLSSIRQLHLHDNMIEEVVDHFMWNLRALTRLYLDGNKLTRVPSLATGGAMLRRLSVANNKITEITENQMLEVWRVKTFNVSYTSITDLNFLSAFRDLRYFDLSNTSIVFTEIPLDIIPRLGALSLADNGLVTFPTFPLFSASKSSLQKVDLSQNKIACIDAQHLANMTKLRYFHLSHNNIEKFSDIGCKDGDNIPQAWHELQFPTLQRFYVDNNQLTDIKRDILVTMPVLEWFVASFNKIRFMPFLQAVGSSLNQAHLDHNDISHIEMEHIAGLSSLKTLQLSYNDITYLNLHILGTLNSLQLFDLRCNKLMTPPILTTINFGSSIEILLTNNSYACDSRMCLLENETLLMDGLLCVTPLRVVDRSVQSFVDSMYCRKYPRQSLCIQH